MRNSHPFRQVPAREIICAFFLLLLCIAWAADCKAVERTRISGTVKYEGSPVCAMVLAGGKHQFTCSGDGSFDLTDVPFDSNDEIILYAFCSGLSPYETILTDGKIGLEIEMSSDPSGQQPVVTIDNFEVGVTKTGWVDISGTIENAAGTPLCAMILVSGQYMFTCETIGQFSLTVPSGSNNKITLYGFCSGLMPYEETIHLHVFEDFNNDSGGFQEFGPFSLSNDTLLFSGDDTSYYYFTSWNGGDNPSQNWYPQPGDSNYFDDFNVSVVTNWDGGSAIYPYGLVVCTQKNTMGNADTIEFDIVKDSYYTIFRSKDGIDESLVDWTPSFLPDIEGQANKLSVQKEDNNFRFFINDTEVENLLIDGFTGGGLALGSTQWVDVQFDDFTVTDPYKKETLIPSSSYLEKLKDLVYKVMTSTYLWYDTVPAVDLTSYYSAEELLEDLIYKDLDRWSYIASKEEYHSLMEEGRYIGLGFGMKFTENDECRIKLVYQNSPAADAGLMRGDRLIEINGKTIEEIEINALWSTIFGDDEIGVMADLKIEDSTGATRNLSLEKKWVTIDSVQFEDVFDLDGLKAGYLVFNQFIETSPEELETVFTSFSQEGIDELILDLRYNPGGRVLIVRYLSELIAGAHIESDIFAQFVHNDRYSAWDFVDYFSSADYSLNLDRVIIITSEETCSASELVINCLKPFIDVVLVGSNTCGKPVGMYGYDLFDKHISPIEFKTVNANGEGDYFDGIPPTCYSEDDLMKQFGDEEESSLLEALNYVRSGSCTSHSLSVKTMKTEKPCKEVPLRGFRQEIGAF
jgi:carboxyl-terminal processing protease